MRKEQKAMIDLKEVLSVGMTLLVLAIGLAIGLQVMSEVRDDFTACDAGYAVNSTTGQCTNTSANDSTTSDIIATHYNATTDGITGLAKFPAKMPLIATVVVAAVVIGLVIRFLGVRFN